MKQTIYKSDFYEAFEDLRPNNFSPAALDVLFDYYEEIDPDFELDVLAICGDWSEYNEEELLKTFGDEEDDYTPTVLRRVKRNHTVLSVASGTSYLVSSN